MVQNDRIQLFEDSRVWDILQRSHCAAVHQQQLRIESTVLQLGSVISDHKPANRP